MNQNQNNLADEALLLQVPPSLARDIRKNLSSSESELMNLTISKKANEASISIGNNKYQATLVNLPCYIEVHKTFDLNQYYKAADISQMLIVQAPTTTTPTHPSLSSSSIPPSSSSLLPSIPVNYPSGLTPPTKDIKPKRYDRNTVVPPEDVSETIRTLENISTGRPIYTFELEEYEDTIWEYVKDNNNDDNMMDDDGDQTNQLINIDEVSSSNLAMSTPSRVSPLKSPAVQSLLYDTNTPAHSLIISPANNNNNLDQDELKVSDLTGDDRVNVDMNEDLQLESMFDAGANASNSNAGDIQTPDNNTFSTPQSVTSTSTPSNLLTLPTPSRVMDSPSPNIIFTANTNTNTINTSNILNANTSDNSTAKRDSLVKEIESLDKQIESSKKKLEDPSKFNLIQLRRAQNALNELINDRQKKQNELDAI